MEVRGNNRSVMPLTTTSVQMTARQTSMTAFLLQGMNIWGLWHSTMLLVLQIAGTDELVTTESCLE
jgi:hypothetical protein